MQKKEETVTESVELYNDSIMRNTIVKKIITVDGYDLNYYVYGIENKPVMTLINAYGIPIYIWKYIICNFSSRYRIVTWETRGTEILHDGIPLEDHLHADDLKRILQAESVQEADFICWCSGFKIMSEYYMDCPQTVKTVSIICGYFNPQGPEMSYWTEFDKTIGRLSHLLVEDKQLTDNPNILKLIEKLFNFNISDEAIPTPEVKALITKPFRTKVSLLNYARITLRLQKHDVSTYLSQFTCPVLIINAGQDTVSDTRCSEIAASRIKDCRYILLESSTHWCLWDDYMKVNGLIDQFLTQA